MASPATWSAVGMFKRSEAADLRESLIEATRVVRKGKNLAFNPRGYAEDFYRAYIKLKGSPAYDSEFNVRDALFEASTDGHIVVGFDRYGGGNIYSSFTMPVEDRERWETLYRLGSMPVWESLTKKSDGSLIVPKDYHSWETHTGAAHSARVALRVDPRITAMVCLSFLEGISKAMADLEWGQNQKHGDEPFKFIMLLSDLNI